LASYQSYKNEFIIISNLLILSYFISLLFFSKFINFNLSIVIDSFNKSNKNNLYITGLGFGVSAIVLNSINNYFKLSYYGKYAGLLISNISSQILSIGIFLLCLIIYLTEKKNFKDYLKFLVPLILLIPFSLKYGRLYTLFSYSFLIFYILNIKLLKNKFNFIIIILFIFLIFIANNLYINHRDNLLSYNFSGSLFTTKYFSDNLRSRSPTWTFLYEILFNINEYNININSNISLLQQSIINVIPKPFLPKSIIKIEVEKIISLRYWLPDTDYPDSIVAEFFCDFGLLSGLIAAACISTIIKINLLIMEFFKSIGLNILTSVIFIRTLYNFYNFEYSFSSILVIERDTLIFSLIIIIIYYVIKNFRHQKIILSSPDK
jgi:hypothetical protein